MMEENGDRVRFKSWMRLFPFHFMLPPLGKVGTYFFFSRAMSKIVKQAGLFCLTKATSLGEGKL